MAPKSGDAGISAMPTEKQPSPLCMVTRRMNTARQDFLRERERNQEITFTLLL